MQLWYKVIEARVATWLPATETWDTSVAIPNLSGIKFDPEMDNDELYVFGAKEHLLSVPVGMKVTMSFGGVDNTSANAMTGMSSTESGSGDDETRKTRWSGGDNLPYFGLIVAVEANDGLDAHLMLPRLKLDSLMALDLAKGNKFVIPNVTAKAARLRLAAGTLYPVMDLLEHAVVNTVETDFAVALLSL